MVKCYSEQENELRLREELDFFDEKRDAVRLKMSAYMQRVCRHYNRRVRLRPLKVGDLVLRKSAATGKAKIDGKLSANWEGPYEIYQEKRPGTYKLQRTDGSIVTSHWKSDVLKKYLV